MFFAAAYKFSIFLVKASYLIIWLYWYHLFFLFQTDLRNTSARHQVFRFTSLKVSSIIIQFSGAINYLYWLLKGQHFHFFLLMNTHWFQTIFPKYLFLVGRIKGLTSDTSVALFLNLTTFSVPSWQCFRLMLKYSLWKSREYYPC